MRSRVVAAFSEVWWTRCTDSCRQKIEFGHSATLFEKRNPRKIVVCRVVDEPSKIVGLFHTKQTDHDEWDILNEKVYSPPAHFRTLPVYYQKLIEGKYPEIAWVSVREEMEAIQ
jgi:hypothetical protein